MELGLGETGVAAAVGGLLVALVPALDGVSTAYELGYGAYPLVLVAAAYGLRRNCDTGRQEHRLLVAGLGLSAAVGLLYGLGRATEASTVLLVVIAPLALFGGVLVAVGSAFTARTLRRRGVLPTWAAVAFGLSLPLDPLVNALVTPLLSVGASAYGVSWAVVGSYLLRASAGGPADVEPSVRVRADRPR